jgi:SAM-dependent methyltransferase
MPAFNEYANFYDSLYEDKDYLAECNFIEGILKEFSNRPMNKFLDLGCGTGGHSIPLAERGYRLTGVDISEEMLKEAEQKSNRLGVDVEFLSGDIRSLDLEISFDAVFAMFAVISYQPTNDDLIAAFRTARRHLEQDGLFIFDTWYGPSVLTIRPAEREKTVED